MVSEERWVVSGRCARQGSSHHVAATVTVTINQIGSSSRLINAL